MYSIIVIALASPLMIGIYKNDDLIDKIIFEGKSSDILPPIFQDILKKYDLKNIIYVRGPGSFMAIKVSYIFLKTLSIVKKINFLSSDAFYFNNNSPIKAIGKLCFVKNKDTISTTVLQELPKSEFFLPTKLNLSDFSSETAPEYVIGAV